MGDTVFRLRITFAKQGRLAWLSHLELVRAVERCIRRSGLPFQLSQGFNQHMKHSFGPALPVGSAGLAELFDIWLTAYVPVQEALDTLQAVAAFDLPVLACGYVAKDAPALQVSHCLARYSVALAGVDERFAALLAKLIAQGQLDVLKKGRRKVYDLGAVVVNWGFEPGFSHGSLNTEPPLIARKLSQGLGPGLLHGLLNITLRLSNEGSLRPEALLAPLLEQLPEAHVVAITRARLFEENQGSDD
jgi:radical SAM-linked protein